MTKIIKCAKCNEYLGEIRDATLRKGVSFNCGKCHKDAAQPSKRYVSRLLDFAKIFDDFFTK